MRFRAFLFAAVALSGFAWAGGWHRSALPAGGVDVIQPGYSFRTPGAGWAMTGTNELENGVIRVVDRSGQWTFARGPENRSEAEMSVRLLRSAAPDGTHDWRGFLLRQHEPSSNPDIRQTVEDKVVNGARCVVSRMEYDRVLKAGSPRVTTYAGRRICDHPELPGFKLELQYRSDSAEGMAEIAAVAESLRFTPVPYRVREIPTGCVAGQIVEAGGALWAICHSENVLADPGKVIRIDPATNRVTAAITVGHTPFDLVAAYGQVWVANASDHTVMRIDPKTNRVAATVVLPGSAMQLMPAAGYLWVASSRLGDGMVLTRIDPATAATGAEVHFDGLVLGVGAGRSLLVWQINKDGWMQLDGRTGATILNAPGKPVHGLRYDGQFAWILQQEGNGTALLRLDPEKTGAAEQVRTLDGMVEDFAAWNGYFCTLEQQAMRCRAERGGAVTDLPRFSLRLQVLAGSLWGTSFDGTSILRLDPK